MSKALKEMEGLTDYLGGEHLRRKEYRRLSNKFHKQQEGRNSSFRVSKRRYDRKSQ